MLGEVLGIEAGFRFFPLVGDLHQDRRDEPEAAGGVGEDRGDAGAAPDLEVEVLHEIGCAQAPAHRLWQAEYGEALG